MLSVACAGLGIVGIGMGAIVRRIRRKPKPLRQKAAPIAPPLKLVVVQGSANRPWLELNSIVLNIGRDPSNQLVIDSPLVSWQHAHLNFVNGYWFITDLQSANGTFVNGVRITQQALRPGDQVRIGTTLLVLQ